MRHILLNRRFRPLRWLLPLGLVVAAAAVLVGLDLAPEPAHSDASLSFHGRTLRPLGVQATGCTETAARPNAVLDLGPSAATLALDDESALCVKTPDGSRPPGIYVSAIYGTCTVADGDIDCAPPLQLQTWPSCLRNAGSYDAVLPDGTELDRPIAFLANGSVPAARFENGLREEVYLPAITVVVFGINASLTRAASNAVAETAVASGVNAGGTTTAPVPAACGTRAEAAVAARTAPSAAKPPLQLGPESSNLDDSVATEAPPGSFDPAQSGELDDEASP